MRRSQCSVSSIGSDKSNILSLSSNKSQINEIELNKNTTRQQLQRLRVKLENLFQIKNSNIDELYMGIERKYSKKYIEDKTNQLNGLLNSLNSIKNNNRQMAKLVSTLGVKVNSKQYKQQKIQFNKKSQSKPYENRNMKTNTTDSINNISVHNGQNSIYNIQNQTMSSYQQYNFQPQPIKSLFNPENLQYRNSYEQNEQIKNRKSYEEYKRKNKKYQDKILQMLNQLGNIKKQLQQQSCIKQPKQQNKNQTNKYFEKQKNNKPNNVNYKKQQISKQGQNRQIQTINKINNEIDKDNKQKKIRQNNNYSNKHISIVEYKQPQVKQYLNKYQSNNKKLFQINSQLITNDKKYQNINDKKYQNIKNKQPFQTQLSLIKNSQNQQLLTNKAKSISLRLQQIKKQILSTQNQPIKINNINNINNNKTNYLKVQDINIKNNKAGNQNQQQFYDREGQKNQQEIIINNKQQKEQSEQDEQQDQLNLSNYEQKILNKRPQKKKSILDQMKNVQSKMIISQKQINNQQTFIDVLNAISPTYTNNQLSIKNNHNQSNSNKQQSNRQSHFNYQSKPFKQQKVISYHTHLNQQINNQNQLKNANQETQFKKTSSQNIMQTSSIKQVIISYSNLNNLNSQHNQFTMHNTSIMNPIKKPLINTSIINSNQQKLPHFNQPSINPNQRVQWKDPFQNNNQSIINSIHQITPIKRNLSQQKLSNKNYSRQKIVTIRPSNIKSSNKNQDISFKRINHSNSAINISLNNFDNRLTQPILRQSSHYISTAINQSQPRFSISNIPPSSGITHSVSPRYSSHMVVQNAPPTSNNSSNNSYLMSRNSVKLINPFQNITTQTNQHSNSIHSIPLRQQRPPIPFNQRSQNPGINLSIMKKNLDESFVVTLGSSSKKFRDSTYSKDSKDSRSKKGVRLSNQFF